MITLQFDGLFRATSHRSSKLQHIPGLMCYGWLIFRNGVIIAHGHGSYIHHKSACSNGAEYLGLIEGLEALLDLNLEGEPVIIIGDSKSIIEQMQGFAAVNSNRVKKLFKRARSLISCFRNIEWQWSPRQYNQAADYLTRRALKQINGYHGGLLDAFKTTGSRHHKGGRRNQFFPILDYRVYQKGITALPL
jgi:ribonuclease HI